LRLRVVFESKNGHEDEMRSRGGRQDIVCSLGYIGLEAETMMTQCAHDTSPPASKLCRTF
jgi:hypothetical protein